ncbi:MAG: TetR family transcriptional regulator [Burkholderiaceae bacterium]|jgi:AcrR family transcriptional regulator|uniref:TetR/AcrR family transcriptional regulator n=1 Tax=Hylemonella sp. TaxID=2066020 RepID=UPI0035B2D56D|nr:TetR family transcriptional regulator [Burkholderiaceae bacterium]
MTPDTKTAKSELTRAAIIGAGMDLVAAEGLEALTLQAVADRVGLSKSGVFSRVGSRETLQKTVIEEFGRRFLAEVFVPAMQQPKGLPRLDAIVERWLARLARPEPHNSCIYSAAAFELDDREGELRDFLLQEITRWRAALRRTVVQSVEAGHLRADTVPEQLVGEIYGLAIGLLHDARFLRDPSAPARAAASWQRLRTSYLA